MASVACDTHQRLEEALQEYCNRFGEQSQNELNLDKKWGSYKQKIIGTQVGDDIIQEKLQDIVPVDSAEYCR
jgi:hypothetical protein